MLEVGGMKIKDYKILKFSMTLFQQRKLCQGSYYCIYSIFWSIPVKTLQY